MSGGADLESLEREAYRAAWSDGIVDLFLGLSLLWIGAMWVWTNDLSGVAGVLPAILVTPMLAGRRRFVEARLGYVRWRAPRRGWERRNLTIALVAGVVLFLLALLMYLFVTGTVDGSRQLAPGIMAWLLALLGVGLAVLLDARRMLLYAAVLAVSGVVVVALDAEPGWPMLLSGAVACVVGALMLWRFVQRYPVIAGP